VQKADRPVAGAGATREARREPSRVPVAEVCPATALDGAPDGAGPTRLGDDPPPAITATPPSPGPGAAAVLGTTWLSRTPATGREAGAG
jgi:hypothetical protein